jgi:two-component system, sensor histidine kinase
LERENAELQAENALLRNRLEKAEAILAQRESQVILGLEQAPALIGVFRGPDLLLTFANTAYREILGPQAIIGLPLAEIFPELVAQGNIALMHEVYLTGRA